MQKVEDKDKVQIAILDTRKKPRRKRNLRVEEVQEMEEAGYRRAGGERQRNT